MDENKFEYKGEQVIIRTPSTDALPHLMRLAIDMNNSEESDNPMDAFKHLTPESLNSLKEVINMTLKATFKDRWQTESEEIKSWGMEQFMEILDTVMNKLNKNKSHEKVKLDKIKDKLNQDAGSQHTNSA